MFRAIFKTLKELLYVFIHVIECSGYFKALIHFTNLEI